MVKFDRLLETYWRTRRQDRVVPRGHAALGAPQVAPAGTLREQDLEPGFRGKVASPTTTFPRGQRVLPSPFDEAAILTIDAVGEWARPRRRGPRQPMTLDRELRFPHSLGMLYSAFTSYSGFKVNAGEYKLMGLAPYGEPRFADVDPRPLVDVKPDGSLRLDLRYFASANG